MHKRQKTNNNATMLVRVQVHTLNAMADLYTRVSRGGAARRGRYIFALCARTVRAREGYLHKRTSHLIKRNRNTHDARVVWQLIIAQYPDVHPFIRGRGLRASDIT